MRSALLVLALLALVVIGGLFGGGCASPAPAPLPWSVEVSRAELVGPLEADVQLAALKLGRGVLEPRPGRARVAGPADVAVVYIGGRRLDLVGWWDVPFEDRDRLLARLLEGVRPCGEVRR